MKLIKYIILFLFLPNLLIGQSKTSENALKIRDEIQPKSKPELILVIGNEKIQLDSISIKKIDSKWIKKIEIVKNRE
jgi:hypothetical protein